MKEVQLASIFEKNSVFTNMGLAENNIANEEAAHLLDMVKKSYYIEGIEMDDNLNTHMELI